jgi:hypothetical protein
MVIIGEDLSKSSEPFPHITTEFIEKICNSISQSNRGGKVVLSAIGNTNPRGYEVCKINPVPIPEQNAPLSQRSYCTKKSREILAENTRSISVYLKKCQALLQDSSQDQTDVNGFLSKAKILAEQPDSDKYQKWLFINTDGKQDIVRYKNEDVDYSLIPKNVKFYTCSWPVKNLAYKTDGNFLDPMEFAEMFVEQVQN